MAQVSTSTDGFISRSRNCCTQLLGGGLGSSTGSQASLGKIRDCGSCWSGAGNGAAGEDGCFEALFIGKVAETSGLGHSKGQNPLHCIVTHLPG